MSWLGVEGHDEVVERFRRSLSRGRLASTFLFVGPAGIGKRLFALRLAQSLLCETTPADELTACGICSACTQVLALTHPDLEIISKPADKSSLPLDLLIGDKEHRMREGLCHRIAMRPSRGGRRIAIIDDADYLQTEGANCLLKTLEEPPKKSVLILLSSSLQRQLPTIRSRCQIVPFRPLEPALLARLLVQHHLVSDTETAERLSAISEGSIQRACELNSPELWQFRALLYETLSRQTWEGAEMGKVISDYVDASGKEAAARRERLRTTIACMMEFLRQLMRELTSGPPTASGDLREATKLVAPRWPQDAEAVADMIQRTMDAAYQIDANASVPTVQDAWIDALVSRYHGSPVA
jgi:DNA polymerase-3 subunit delta'